MLGFASLSAQESDYDSLLQRIDTVENPVYKPVISLSTGILTFRGEVQNASLNPGIGNMAVGINVATYIDRKHHYFVANFNILAGTLSASQYSHTDLSQNLNFETSLFSFGVNVEYRFGHLIDKASFIRPFVSLGLENISYSSKGDLLDADQRPYHYWSDGSIRDMPEEAGGTPSILYRDYSYETDLRLREQQEFGLGEYKQRSLAIPATVGMHFLISKRSFFSLGFSYHYTFSDYMDNVAQEGTSLVGKKGNDSYLYSHVAFHLDLFSDPSTRTVDLMFADVEFDPLFFDDEDGDFVLDVSDRCPGTPYGVAVDSLGCPLDGDADGVPDYLDQELESAPGVWVDETGVTVGEEAFYAALASRNPAMPRQDLDLYLETIRGEYEMRGSQKIPEKFKALDQDGDNYISFDELLLTVDQYFDFELDLNLDELRELNQFFFSQ